MLKQQDLLPVITHRLAGLLQENCKTKCHDDRNRLGSQRIIDNTVQQYQQDDQRRGPSESGLTSAFKSDFDHRRLSQGHCQQYPQDDRGQSGLKQQFIIVIRESRPQGLL